jgi:phosphoglycolate phosphatase-like HAD superfamily hydrolase
MSDLIPVFDLDGTLIDSDEALVMPFLELGIAREDITFGLPAEQACIELDVSIDDYVRLYDVDVVQPFEGAEELISSLGRWAVCSNKHPESAAGELARLGWKPEVALFTDAFEGRPKELAPVLSLLGVGASEVLFVGDTDHDRRCAEEVGAKFAWAGWNPRCAARSPQGVVLTSPLDVLDLL